MYTGSIPLLSGILRITDVVQFALISSSGLATSVTWTRDGVIVAYDSTHVLTQTVVDTNRVARYRNTLTMTGVESGHYP